MAKVSIIIPVYNPAQYLIKCLESVCGQTLRDIEIILINDCSTDGSLLLLQEYAKRDNRIKLIDLKENKGAAVARNIGIENASGEYLGFVDSDDFIDLNFYERLYEKASRTEADAVKGNIIMYHPQTNSTVLESWIDINYLVKKHKANFCYFFTSAIYKSSLIKENSVNFLEGLIHFEDPYFTIKAALFYQKLEVIDDVFYYYVNNQDSSSRKKFTTNHIESLIDGVGKVLDLLDNHCTDKTHYIIVFNFLLEQVFQCCCRFNVDDEINIKSVKGLFLLYDRCRYKEECAIQYFLQKKSNQKNEIFKQLRNRIKISPKHA